MVERHDDYIAYHPAESAVYALPAFETLGQAVRTAMDIRADAERIRDAAFALPDEDRLAEYGRAAFNERFAGKIMHLIYDEPVASK